jgi:hypothetical protein
MFVEAHASYRRTNYAAIADKIGSKTAEEVKVYSLYFFEKAPNNERLVDKLKQIIYKQGRLNKSTNNADNTDPSVKVISQEVLKSSSDDVSKPNDEASSEEDSAATEAK